MSDSVGLFLLSSSGQARDSAPGPVQEEQSAIRSASHRKQGHF